MMITAVVLLAGGGAIAASAASEPQAEITQADYIDWAITAGFEDAKDPLASYLASCLTGLGQTATIDAEKGGMWYSGPVELVNQCLADLLAANR